MFGAILLLLICSLLCLFWFKAPQFSVVFSYLGFFVLGYASFMHHQSLYDLKCKDEWLEGAYLFEVASAVTENAKGKKTAVLEIAEGDKMGLKVLATIALEQSKKVERGDFIVFRGKIKPTFPPKRPYDFDYKSFLENKGIGHTLFLKDEHILLHRKGENTLFSLVDCARSWAIATLKRLIPDSKLNSVAIALVVGEKSLIEKETKSNFSTAGLMHVLAVSGMHVGLVYLFLNAILSAFFLNNKTRWLKFGAVTVFLGFYSLFTGFSASVVRACFMCVFAAYTKLVKRNSNLFHLLFACAFFMLLFNPMWVFEIGFQLSFVAVLGIALFYQPLNECWQPFNHVMRFFWSSFCVTIAAQLAVTPITIYYFNSFPTYFIFSNLFVLPIAVASVYLSISSLLLSFVPYINLWLGKLTSLFLWLNQIMVEFIANLPSSSIQKVWLSKMELIVFYAAILCLFAVFVRRNQQAVLGMVFLMLILIGVKCYYLCFEKTIEQTNEVFVFEEKGKPVAVFSNQKEAWVFHADDSLFIEMSISQWLAKNGVRKIHFKSFSYAENLKQLKISKGNETVELFKVFDNEKRQYFEARKKLYLSNFKVVLNDEDYTHVFNTNLNSYLHHNFRPHEPSRF